MLGLHHSSAEHMDIICNFLLVFAANLGVELIKHQNTELPSVVDLFYATAQAFVITCAFYGINKGREASASAKTRKAQNVE